MTAVLVLESLRLDKKVTVSANAHATGGSGAGLQRGEVLTVEQLLTAMLVASANDAAVALAEATSGSVGEFAKKMNAKARELGLTNTHFVNPDGLNAERHFSSAKDLATLARYAMQEPLFRQIVRTREYALPYPGDEPPRKLKNSNALLGKQAWVTGIKTGSTPYAGYCLVASGTRDGVSLLSVILGASDDSTRWSESQSLLEFGFSLYPRTVLADKGQVFDELATPDVLGRRIRLVAERSLTVSLFKSDAVTTSVHVDRPVTLPVHVGEVFGAVEFSKDGKSVGSVNLVAAQPIEKASFMSVLDHWRALGPPLALDNYLGDLPAGWG
jgi:serine-type D-Ala-D-Ala carboxypeptidase (penicillin-binding protein 5/6)